MGLPLIFASSWRQPEFLELLLFFNDKSALLGRWVRVVQDAAAAGRAPGVKTRAKLVTVMELPLTRKITEQRSH